LEVRRCDDGHPPVTERERVIRLNGIGGVTFQTRIENFDPGFFYINESCHSARSEEWSERGERHGLSSRAGQRRVNREMNEFNLDLIRFLAGSKPGPEMFESLASWFAFRCSASLNMTTYGVSASAFQRI
jgi:hypothetical protein